LDTRGSSVSFQMFALANRTDINQIEDFSDKIVAAAALTTTGGGQSQIYEMFKRGLSFVADPKQMVFTVSQKKVIEGVMKGDFDVGFVRTDELEKFIGNYQGKYMSTGQSILSNYCLYTQQVLK